MHLSGASLKRCHHLPSRVKTIMKTSMDPASLTARDAGLSVYCSFPEDMLGQDGEMVQALRCKRDL